MTGKELEFVRWLSRRQWAGGPVVLGIGDDMAIIAVAGGNILVASDMLLDGVHFDVQTDDLTLIGRKAIACNLSDCAAMAVRPVAVTISVAWPANLAISDAQQVYEGMEAIAGEFDLAIAGGDTTCWDKPLAIDVAIVAQPYPAVEPIRRSGAKPGDTLYVTGPLGGSRLGHHLSFEPRVREAELLARALGVRLHAMIDLSDGLSLDLNRLGEASGVGALIEEGQLDRVVSDRARQLANVDGRSPIEHALSDGEDYELLLAVDGEARVPGVPLWPVGVITEAKMLLRRQDGSIEPLLAKGYIH